MGSSLTRHLRDLSDVAGFEAPYAPSRESNSHLEKSILTDSRPATPTAISGKSIDWDPRSPSAEIVRTPIEVCSHG